MKERFHKEESGQPCSMLLKEQVTWGLRTDRCIMIDVVDFDKGRFGRGTGANGLLE